jgi:hypothetical protein
VANGDRARLCARECSSRCWDPTADLDPQLMAPCARTHEGGISMKRSAMSSGGDPLGPEHVHDILKPSGCEPPPLTVNSGKLADLQKEAQRLLMVP